MGIHPNMILLDSFFFRLLSIGGVSRRPSRGEGLAGTLAFRFVTGTTGGTTSDEVSDAVIEAAAMTTRRGEEITFLTRLVERDVVLVGEDGAKAADAGEGASFVDVVVVAVDGGNSPSGIEGDIADKFPLHWV